METSGLDTDTTLGPDAVARGMRLARHENATARLSRKIDRYVRRVTAANMQDFDRLVAGTLSSERCDARYVRRMSRLETVLAPIEARLNDTEREALKRRRKRLRASNDKLTARVYAQLPDQHLFKEQDPEYDGLTNLQKAIYVMYGFECARLTRNNGRFQVAHQYIARRLHCSAKTVQRAVATFKRIGLLNVHTVRAVRADGNGRTFLGHEANAYEFVRESHRAWVASLRRQQGGGRSVRPAQPALEEGDNGDLFALQTSAPDVTGGGGDTGVQETSQVLPDATCARARDTHSETQSTDNCRTYAQRGRGAGAKATQPGPSGSLMGKRSTDGAICPPAEDGPHGRSQRGDEDTSTDAKPEVLEVANPNDPAATPVRLDLADPLTSHLLMRAALDELGHEVPDGGIEEVIAAVDSLRLTRFPNFWRQAWTRALGRHGEYRSRLAVLTTLVLAKVRRQDIGEGRPAEQYRTVHDPCAYLGGLLNKDPNACRPEVTLAALLANKRFHDLTRATEIAGKEHSEFMGYADA